MSGTLASRLIALAVLLAAARGEALTIHRSFRSRDVGFGGGIGASVPVDARVDKAIDEGLAKEAERPKALVGRVTRVVDGRTLRLVTDGGTLVPVRLEGVEVPTDAPRAQAMAAALRKLVQGRQVRVGFRVQDDDGFVLGQVTCGKRNVNEVLAKGTAVKGAAVSP